MSQRSMSIEEDEVGEDVLLQTDGEEPNMEAEQYAATDQEEGEQESEQEAPKQGEEVQEDHAIDQNCADAMCR